MYSFDEHAAHGALHFCDRGAANDEPFEDTLLLFGGGGESWTSNFGCIEVYIDFLNLRKHHWNVTFLYETFIL